MPDIPAGLRGWPLVLRVAEEMLLGERPPTRRVGPRPHRAARARLKEVRVDASAVTWLDRRGRVRQIGAAAISRVALIDVVPPQRHSGAVRMYALVIGHDEAVHLRVVADGRLRDSAASKRRLRDVWAPLGVPVARETGVSARPNDYRRRWPEAFGFVPARPFVTFLLFAVFWMLVVVPVLDHTIGP